MEAIDATPLQKVQRVLEEQGVLAALRVINGRAPHRYTGIYQYTPEILRNLHLVDAYDPRVERGDDVKNEDAYCVLLSDARTLAFGEGDVSVCAPKLGSPVVSYCGVLLVTAEGTPFGSLCHFDTRRCQRPSSEMPLLEALAPLIMAKLEAQGVG